MSDLEAALEPVRQMLERRDAARRDAASRNGTAEPDSLQALLDAAQALERPADNGAASRDRDVIEQNLADVRAIVKRLRSAAH